MSHAATAVATDCVSAQKTACDTASCQPVQLETPLTDVEALLAIARNAGMLVMLDGQIGREKYQSVAGSVTSLQRFAIALGQMMQASHATL